jgi:ComF family protein
VTHAQRAARDGCVVRVPLPFLTSLLAPPVCAGCGGHAGAAEPLCAACRRELRWLDRAVESGGLTVFAPLAYEGPARAMVRALKFRGATMAADAMAAQIAAAAPPGVLARGVLVPVPLHPRRLRRRGFNQAELLARALGERTGLRVDDCLARHGSPRTQVGRDRAQRLAGVDGTIAVRGGSAPPRRAVVVDDVVTTGATLAACACALRAAGAVGVAAVAYARTPGR